MGYVAEFGLCTSNGIRALLQKLGTLGPRILGLWGNEIPLGNRPFRTCYRAKFGRFMSNGERGARR